MEIDHANHLDHPRADRRALAGMLEKISNADGRSRDLRHLRCAAARIRAVAAAVTSRGGALSFQAHTVERESVTLLSLPAPEPRWPLTDYFTGDEGLPDKIVDFVRITPAPPEPRLARPVRGPGIASHRPALDL